MFEIWFKWFKWREEEFCNRVWGRQRLIKGRKKSRVKEETK